MNSACCGVQRIVLHGSHWKVARHLALGFADDAHPLHFIHRLREDSAIGWPSEAGTRPHPAVQVSLGFTRRGLERARVPQPVLSLFALKSPAFWAGAALRAGRHLGMSGSNGPGQWEAAFDPTQLDAVLSLHSMDEGRLQQAEDQVRFLAALCKVRIETMTSPRRLEEGPPDEAPNDEAQWVHFGYRDGLARVVIKDWPLSEPSAGSERAPKYELGEFLLGHPQGSGANPWIAGPGARVWSERVRTFFRNGSFGVLHQIEQDVEAFESFIARSARETGLTPRELKAKICGRYPDGRPLAGAPDCDPKDEFDYSNDLDGYQCPYGAHMRRMNPRGDALPHALRVRPLLRRGMPYGPPWRNGSPPGVKRGLMAQFFCASIEDQFEHLVAEWGDRVPVGSNDPGRARDPLMGAHETGDGAYWIPIDGQPPKLLKDLRPVTRTAGVAYLFYPGLHALEEIATELRRPWPGEDDE
jgi:deferrochelatase/peroxidase EfeB